MIAAALSWERGAHDAALIAFAGALAFRQMVLPHALRREVRALAPFAAACGILALLAGAAWFMGEAAQLAQPRKAADLFGAVPAFVAYLPFAQFLLARLALVLLALLLPCQTGRAAAALGALGLQPWLGHPAQAGLAAPGVLHLLAAGLWAGGLAPLVICLAVLPRPTSAQVFRRFSVMGAGAVVVLAASGIAQAWVLAGGAAGLTGSLYGRIALLKSALFALALALAALNGLVLTPLLARSAGAARALRASVATEAVIAICIVLAAGWLANAQPG